MENTICRIGVFYDGSFFTYSQNYFYHNRKIGWLRFQPFHDLLENVVRDKEQGHANYKIVYAGWYQGLFTSKSASEDQLKRDRNLHQDLLHNGIEPKYLPISGSEKEKGVDVAMAVDIMQVALDDKIDMAILITGDGDFIPLVRALMKHGVRVMATYFCYEDGDGKSYINERLLRICNYSLNINDLEKDHKYKSAFKNLFYQPENK